MTSSPSRNPLSGVIRQKERIVGAICLPEVDLPEFIAEFNRCYGPLSMHIDTPDFAARIYSRWFPLGLGSPEYNP